MVPTPRAERLGRLGVELRTGDYDDPASLRAAMLGIERLLFVSSSSVEPRGTRHRNVIEAAENAGVGFVAYTSILTARDTPLLLAADHRETEAMLTASNLPHVILRNGWYIENHMLGLPRMLEFGVMSSAAGGGRFSSASRADYAEAAAAVMLHSAPVEGPILELAGDPGYTLAELAAEIARQSGMPVRSENMTPAAFEAAPRETGMPEGLATILADTDAGAAGGALHDHGGALTRLIGRPTTPLRDAVAATLKAHCPAAA